MCRKNANKRICSLSRVIHYHIEKTMNFRQTKKVAPYVFGIVCYYILFQSFYNMVADKTLWPYDDLHQFCMGVLHNFTPVLFTIMMSWLIVFKGHRSHSSSTKLLVDGALCVLLLFLINGAYTVIAPSSDIDWAGTAFNSIFVFLGVETLYYVHHFKNSVRVAEEQRALALQYQYDALKAQVNPHFLFNSLNLLYSLVSIDQQKSKEFILALSKIYRYILSQQGHQTVSLAQELEFLNDYVEVLMMRYHNQFDVEIGGDLNNAAEVMIVPYTLQLLMENITKHNVISNRHHMRVKINICEDSLVIENPIMLRHTESGARIGLNYINKLYRQHGKEFLIENDGITFRAIVPFL